MRAPSFLLAALLTATAANAQGTKPPAAHPLGPVEATSTELLGAVSTARALPDGKVLINDVIGRRVLLFEKGLASYIVVADTTPATGNAYAGRFAGLIAYKGDSTLFVDPQSLSMMVIDPSGKIGRVMSVPRPNEAQSLVAGNGGIPAFDGQGRLVYRATSGFRFAGPASAGAPGGGGARVRAEGSHQEGEHTPGRMTMPDFPDSSAIVRVELATRKLDTVAFVRIPKTRMASTTDTSGRTMMTSVINPLPQVDDWAVLADGSVAVVRGLDYHVDWFRRDGTTASTERLPFEWRPLNDSSKAAFLDSTKVAMEKLRAAAQAQMAANPGRPPQPMGDAGSPQPMMVFRMQGGPPGSGGDSPRPRDQTSGGSMSFTMPPLTFVEPNELPDYVPPFTTGAARADMDGNLWIRTSIVVNGGPIYDVVDAQGKLVDRVSLPAGRVIAGFGTGGIVYMGVREEHGVRLEQARRTVVAP